MMAMNSCNKLRLTNRQQIFKKELGTFGCDGTY